MVQQHRPCSPKSRRPQPLRPPQRTSEPVDSLSCVVSCKKLLLMVQVRKSAGRPLLALLMVLLLMVPGPASAGVSR